MGFWFQMARGGFRVLALSALLVLVGSAAVVKAESADADDGVSVEVS